MAYLKHVWVVPGHEVHEGGRAGGEGVVSCSRVAQLLYGTRRVSSSPDLSSACCLQTFRNFGQFLGFSLVSRAHPRYSHASNDQTPSSTPPTRTPPPPSYAPPSPSPHHHTPHTAPLLSPTSHAAVNAAQRRRPVAIKMWQP